MRITISSDFEAMSLAAAEDFISRVENTHRPLICLPSGRSPVAFLKVLRDHFTRHRRHPDWYFVGLDEWVGVAQHEKGSCRHFLEEHLFGPLGVRDERVSFFDGMSDDLEGECRRAEDFIDRHRGIDVCVLGIGTNGHLGLNEPGSDRGLRTQVVPLAESTLQASTGYFDTPRRLSMGVTLGLATLMDARTVYLLASGAGKASIMKSALEGPVTVEVPGSLLQGHADCRIHLDEAAASLLTVA